MATRCPSLTRDAMRSVPSTHPLSAPRPPSHRPAPPESRWGRWRNLKTYTSASARNERTRLLPQTPAAGALPRATRRLCQRALRGRSSIVSHRRSLRTNPSFHLSYHFFICRRQECRVRHQLRLPEQHRRLRPPHRPYRPRGREGDGHHAVLVGEREECARPSATSARCRPEGPPAAGGHCRERPAWRWRVALRRARVPWWAWWWWRAAVVTTASCCMQADESLVAVFACLSLSASCASARGKA